MPGSIILFKSRRSLPIAALIALVLVLSSSQLSTADVLIRQKSTTGGFGGMGASEISSTIVISGNKQHTETETRFTGKLARMLADNTPAHSIEIVELDRGLIWRLDPDRREYTETPLASIGKMFGQSPFHMPAGESADDNSDKADKVMSPPPEFTVEIEETGKKKKINGFETEQKILRVHLPAATSGSGPMAVMGEMEMVFDLWLTSQAPGLDELEGFQRRFADKIGISPSLWGNAGNLGQLFGGGMREVARAMEKLEGYAILSTLTIESKQLSAAMTETRQERAKGSSETPQGFSLSALGLGGDGPLFRMTQEVLEIRTTDTPTVSYKIPSGFTLVERTLPFTPPGK